MGTKRETGVTAMSGARPGSRRGLRGQRGKRTFLALAAAAALAGCSVGVPDQSAPKAAPAAPTLATPTITPGHDAAAVAARDMPFAAGGTLAAGVPVRLSDGLRDVPRWSPGKENVAGASEYVKEDGCVVSAKVRNNQAALAVSGDDRASTEALFRYLDASILPAYLKPETLRWGGEPGKPAPRVDVLMYTGGERSGARATAIYARLFSTSGSSVYVSASCPDAATLAAARTDAEAWIAVVPPSG
ncbi:hypothetical protein J2W14_001280 [Pseudarthrobacter oxydans]|uniref:hypothetical protein n=1 Tax=Pseudarthrobacter oxydans TaxID=1671 RepID=UPI0027851C49|nr:hypothetical protein [Pseudarthrobacter oxydans]MDP9981896.1 hypothetical protein [Pseudarthrobacter oxydans]